MTRDPGAAPVRPLAFAGSWYESAPARLAGQVDAWLSASVVTPAEAPVGLLAPHAGLRYSGAVAAQAYACLRQAAPGVVVLVGPSHYTPFRGCAMLRGGALATPWMPLPVHEGLAGALAASSPLLAEEHRAVHDREHSLELHLPFLARVQPDVPVLPILMGEQTRSAAFALGDLLAGALAGARAVLVASSDLSHHQHAARARTLDGEVLEYVDAFDADGLMGLLEREPGHACGGGPLVAVMHACRQLGAEAGRVLRYADSGDVSGDKDRVVGYAAAAFTAIGSA